MRIVYKYPIGLNRLNVLEIPEGAQFLHVAMQRDTPTLWFMVDPQAVDEKRTFVVVGTGEGIHSRADSLTHLGTVLTSDGEFVWHIFELKQR